MSVSKLRGPMDRPRIFMGPRADVPMADIALGRQLRSAPLVDVPAVPVVDLTDKPKVVLVIGAGRCGKTVMCRFLCERALLRDPECSTIFCAIGDRRDLKAYFPRVAAPETFNAAQDMRWLKALMSHCAEQQVSAAVDLDGGDMTLAGLVEQQSDLCGMMEAAGVLVVALYLLSSRVTDLTTLATFEQSGFQPRATALVLNDGLDDPTIDFETRFASVQRHPAFKSAVDRGAVVLRMPRLFDVSARLEAMRLGFVAARDGDALGLFDRGHVASWLQQMDEAMAPVASWMP